MTNRHPTTPEGYSHNGQLNLTGKPEDISPTMRRMPYDGKPAKVGDPDLKAGKGCK